VAEAEPGDGSKELISTHLFNKLKQLSKTFYGLRPVLISLLVLLLSDTGAQAQPIQPYIIVLGTAQDGGYPHAGCQKKCCAAAWTNDSLRSYVVSLALVDQQSKKWWLFEATPDIKYQLQYFRTLTDSQYAYLPSGIFITHAHIGHYAGLAQLGREVLNSKEVPVYALPRMAAYLQMNGPWSQLVKLKNISINRLFTHAGQLLNDRIVVETFTVPHRDEYSETAGFKIKAGRRTYLFIPDIDKWEKWSKNIVEEVKGVDVAFLDATFSDADELPDRKMSEVPHPFVSETLILFQGEEESVKNKLHFIHFNHTNPLLWDNKAIEQFGRTGANLAEQGDEL
jgi:pyrroloquinoline quinone biosynthesis protein B